MCEQVKITWRQVWTIGRMEKKKSHAKSSSSRRVLAVFTFWTTLAFKVWWVSTVAVVPLTSIVQKAFNLPSACWVTRDCCMYVEQVRIYSTERDTFIQTCVVTRNLQLAEHPVRFPPPVVLRLRELRLSIMPIKIRIQRIVAQHLPGPAQILHSNFSSGNTGCASEKEQNGC